MSKELPPQYNPKEVEEKIYRIWEKSGFFDPDRLLPTKSRKPFTIIMPPPNANGSLHIGNAVFVTLQDIIIRYKRMRGLRTLWLPGADHAGFETQVVFDKKLEKEGRSRFQIPRDQLYQEMLAFTLENKKVVEGQIRKLGASCDWSREKFTLDPDIITKTQEAFADFYKKGLVYRGERIINWCVKHQTALADLETKHIEKKGLLYYLQYGPFVIATARPETKFGDKYVVMHPKDKRYTGYKHGQKLTLEWINGPITATVVKDEAIDTQFGTGAMTITPWHDPADFEIAERHKLDKQQIIGQDGRLSAIAGEFAGMKIAEARPKIVEKLKAKGLVVKIEEQYNHTVAVCYKCKTTIEPQVMPQWFLKMRPLAKKAIKVVQTGKIKFIPPRFKKVYFQWLRNIRDWNLSQQITWGIRIPVWYCRGMIPDGAKKMGFAGDIVSQVFDRKTRTYRTRDHGLAAGDKVFFENSADGTIFGYGIITEAKNATVGEIDLRDPKHWAIYDKREQLIAAFKRHHPEMDITDETPVWIYTYKFTRDPSLSGCGATIVSAKPPLKCPACNASFFRQDPDVFTTWFSSGQWPFLALGFPDAKDYKTFYPTDVMETGWDILFFWVARMIMLGLARTGKIPFKTVYLHGLVRDKDRQKMSKSKGNVIDPLGVAELYGTDAVRMALVIGNLPGNDIVISEDKIRGYRNFANKIWNATRFLLTHIAKPPQNDAVRYNYNKEERAMRGALQKLSREVTKEIEDFRFRHAAEKLYHFFWHYYADKVIETLKLKLMSDDSGEQQAARALLLEFHATLIKLLHPFMPFVTEEIWSHLPLKKKKLLMVEEWPH